MNYSILLDKMDTFFPNAFNCCCSDDLQVSTPFTPHYTTKYPDIDRGMNYSILLDKMDTFFPNAFNCCCSDDLQVSTPFTPHYTTKYPDIDRGMNYSILLDKMDKCLQLLLFRGCASFNSIHTSLYY